MPSLDEWLTRWYAAVNSPYIAKQNEKMMCYNPVDLQSNYLGFHPEEGDAVQQLQRRYTVVGPLDEIDKVACVIYIHYTGWIPQACNCTTPQTTSHRNFATTHSVKHHGDTFNTTVGQDEKIEWLVKKDNILYRYAKTIFGVQSRAVEEKYGFKLCEKAGNFSL